MDWEYAEEFRKAPWNKLSIKGKNVGTYKIAGNIWSLNISQTTACMTGDAHDF
jgi:hypothetical protein